MQSQKKAYVKTATKKETQSGKATTSRKLLTRTEQLEKFADIIIDIYNELTYETKKEPTVGA